MRKPGLVAFGITTAVLVPAALHHLDAGSAQVARLAAPGARSMTLSGARIDVAADRSIIDAGGKVGVTLTAREAAPQKVTVAVVVMESVGSGGGRVETPPRQIARELVTFAPGVTGEQHRLSFALRGFRGMEMDGKAPFGHYSILVMAPKAADQLARLRTRAAREANPMEDADGRYGAWASAYYAIGAGPEEGSEPEPEAAAVVGAVGATARLDVYTRPTGGPIALTVPDRARAGEPYQAIVTVKNPGKKRITALGVNLQRPPLGTQRGRVDACQSPRKTMIGRRRSSRQR